MKLDEFEQAIKQVEEYLTRSSEEHFRGISRWRIDQLDKLFSKELVDDLKIELVTDPNEAGPWDYPFTFVYQDKGFRFQNIYQSGATLVCDTSSDLVATKGQAAATNRQLAECFVELLPIAVKPKPIEGKVFSAREVREWEPLAHDDLIRGLYGQYQYQLSRRNTVTINSDDKQSPATEEPMIWLS